MSCLPVLHYNMDSLQAQITSELHKIVAMIEQLTGLRSNWNGDLILVPPDAPYKGMKPFSCAIHLRADLVISESRWRTLIHEVFHAISTGYIASAFAEHIGWEEGTVEQLQRLYRDAILNGLNVSVDRNLLADEDATHAFNRYIEALERVRQVFGMDDVVFIEPSLPPLFAPVTCPLFAWQWMRLKRNGVLGLAFCPLLTPF